MKLICSRQKLNEAVTNVQRAVAAKSTIAALEGILLKAQNGKLRLSGEDLEIGITTAIDADIVEEGAIVINAKLFSEIIRRMPDGPITIETNDKLIVYLKCGKSDYKIIGIPEDEFPEMPAVTEAKKITIDGETLQSMIRQTLYAVSDKDTKPAHKGSLFEISGKKLRIISVDGYRLAIREEDIDYEGEEKFIIPSKTLGETQNLISDKTKEVYLTVGSKHIILKIGEYEIISRLIEGEFMNYRSAVPTQYSTNLKVNTRKFMAAIDRMSMLLNERLRTPIRCRIENDLIKISCSSPLGQAYDEFEVSAEGEDLEIGFHNKYMLDALRFSETDEMTIHMNGPLSPIVLLPSEGTSFTFLVLPVRLRNEN